jgi:alpha-methylacyl-CoA racemase
MPGPLAGLKVVELEGRGPGPFGAMVLADLGAEVVRLCRPPMRPATDDSPTARMIAGRRQVDLVLRGRRSIAIDLKHPDGLAAALRLVESADVLIEGYRPGAAERLGIGPDACLARNPRLVYARITGWGQDGPYANAPGHDVNYVALSGALDLLRRRADDAPAPPLNLLGDYGGGGMLLVVGVLAALFERSRSGSGQVVDAAMVDGVALLTTIFHGMMAEGLWPEVPGTHVLQLGAPFYNVYETADGRYVSVGAGEPQFYAQLVERIGADPALVAKQSDPTTWPDARERLAAIFRTKSRDEWCDILEGTDTCFAPVLTATEAPAHAHLRARATYVEVDGVNQPAPAPRFGRTPAGTAGSLAVTGQDTTDVLAEWGFTPTEIDDLLQRGAVVQAERSAR